MQTVFANQLGIGQALKPMADPSGYNAGPAGQIWCGSPGKGTIAGFTTMAAALIEMRKFANGHLLIMPGWEAGIGVVCVTPMGQGGAGLAMACVATGARQQFISDLQKWGKVEFNVSGATILGVLPGLVVSPAAVVKVPVSIIYTSYKPPTALFPSKFLQ